MKKEKIILGTIDNICDKVNSWTGSSFGYSVKGIKELKNNYIIVLLIKKN